MSQKDTDISLLEAFPEKISEIKKEIQKVIIDQEKVIDLVLTSLFSGGHSFLIGLPGLAKTLLVKTVAQCLGVSFNRVQFTPDLMPLDILGSEILQKNKEFEFIKGPIFGNIILADEINRTPPKTQAALLEAMQERRVTISGKSYDLPNPFFVLATQNPIEQEGTYPLPEAQLDRFLFSISIDYPSFEGEKKIALASNSLQEKKVNAVISRDDILQYQKLVEKIPVSDNVAEYAVSLCRKSRPQSSEATKNTNEFVDFGAGPRASAYLLQAAKCDAIMRGNPSPDIENVKNVALPVLGHRIILNFRAKSENFLMKDFVTSLTEE